jgi:3-methyl-2-oxobutanoate hydroxymethyltransferase
LARAITERVRIPTIGIGAGPWCDGQVQVLQDILGLYPDFVPRHAKQYLRLGELTRQAVAQYAAEVQEGSFPGPEHSHSMDEKVLEEVLALAGS